MSSDSKDLCLGIDIGTTSVKICLLETQTQSLVFSTSEPTRASIPDAEDGRDEQDVSKIIDAVHACMMRVTDARRAAVRCMAISGQMHGVMVWNSENQSRLDGAVTASRRRTSHLYTWQDRRATEEFIASLPQPDSHQQLATGTCSKVFSQNLSNVSSYLQEALVSCDIKIR